MINSLFKPEISLKKSSEINFKQKQAKLYLKQILVGNQLIWVAAYTRKIAVHFPLSLYRNKILITFFEIVTKFYLHWICLLFKNMFYKYSTFEYKIWCILSFFVYIRNYAMRVSTEIVEVEGNKQSSPLLISILIAFIIIFRIPILKYYKKILLLKFSFEVISSKKISSFSKWNNIKLFFKVNRYV